MEICNYLLLCKVFLGDKKCILFFLNFYITFVCGLIVALFIIPETGMPVSKTWKSFNDYLAYQKQNK